MNDKAPADIAASAVDYDPFGGTPISRVVPTTEPQREVWLADRLGREASLAYNESVSLRMRGPLDTEALRAAVQDLVDRHESLRCTLSPDGAELLIAAATTIDVPLFDHPLQGGAEPAAAIAAARERAVETPFDLEKGPLFRAEIHRAAENEHVLLLTAHHIVCDGWSFGVLVQDLARLYARRTGSNVGTLEPPASFADYAAEQAAAAGSEANLAEERFWLSRFAGATPVLDLPADRPRPAWRCFASRRLDYPLDASLVSEVRKTGARNGASLFATLLCAFSVLMQRIAAASDVVIGVPAAGQSASGKGGLVGHCVNLLPLRLAVEPAAASTELIASTQSAILDAYEHQGYTFGSLLRKLAIPRDAGRMPLVSVMFNLDRELDANAAGFPGLEVDFASVPRRFENFELFVNAVQIDGALRLECQYNAQLFDEATARRWFACYEKLLRSLCASPERPAGQLDFLPREDLERLGNWNATTAPFDRESLAHELFEQQAARSADRIAVRHEGATLTYGELEAKANRIARALRVMGVQRGTLVGLHLPRNPGMLAALLGVLKAGGGYVPLDPAYPGDRLRFMARDAGLHVLVTQGDLASAIEWPRESALLLDADEARIAAQPETPLPRDAAAAEPGAPAYVIYTSGSTGKPKGVQVPHRAVVNFLAAMAREPGLAEGDRMVAVTTLSFDIAVNELLLPLAQGAQIVLATPEEAGDGAALGRLIAESDATVMQATPATWRLLIEAGWRSSTLRAWCGGEALGADLAKQLLGRVPELWNLYGPTETTVWSTCGRLAGTDAPIGIGHPIANTTVWVLDEQRQVCPIGIPGELWIGGDGVTLGYLGQPELTAERFVPDPFSAVPGARLYRTGDRGRWRDNGQLEHLGRIDFQVKVRGYRIEPGEIEAALSAAPGIQQSLVLAREDRPGDVRLVAYLVAAPGATVSADALKAQLRSVLPEYMVPQHFMVVPSMPLLPNGKIDRKALPSPQAQSAAAVAFVAPQSPIELSIAAEMENVLAVTGIGLDDNFFALGGHSLLAAQLAARLGRAFEMQVPLRAVFDAPTVGGMAKWIQDRSAAGKEQAWKIPRRPDRGMAPLSLMQHRLWFLEQLDPGRAIFNTPSAHRLHGRMNEAAFRRAFAELVRRQEVLRTRIEVVGDAPMQVIVPELAGELLPGEDLSALAPDERQAALTRRIAELTAEPFNLSRAPLFRARLIHLAEDDAVFFFCAHHIIWDGWSFDILYHEMSNLYPAFRDGKPVALPEPPLAYGDFAAWHRDWMRGEELATQLAHWKERLAGPLETLALPCDRPRPPQMSGRGASTWMLLPPEKAEAARALGRSGDATLFMVLLAAFTALLNQLTGQREIIVGVPVRGRPLAELEQLMGLFVNALPLRLRIDRQASFAQLLAEVRACAIDAFKHPDVPFEELVIELKVPRDRSRFPLYQTTLSFQDARGRDFEWGDLKHERVPVYQPGIAEDLGLWLVEGPWGLRGALVYNTDIIEARTAELLRQRFAHFLDFVLAHPDSPLAQVPLAKEEERQLAQWNATSTPFSETAVVHELIAAQVARTPQRQALSHGTAGLSYAELEAHANRLAHALRGRGARRGQRVGLCLERGLDMVVAQLAILKTGAAYVPLDPSYPPERLKFMAADAGLLIVVTEPALAVQLGWPREQLLLIDQDADAIAGQPDGPLGQDPDAAGPMDAAYVIYTSGTTGKPKGVQVPHRAVVNFLESMRSEPGIGESDRLVAVTTLSFDIAVLELLLPLTVGAEVILASREQAADPHALARLLEESRATIMQATPATWRMLLDAGWKGERSLKALIGGEALGPDLAKRMLPAVGELWNMYGPTETTVWSTCCRIESLESGISIGHPIRNTEVWIVDEGGGRCPIGVAGEIWIGGDGLSLGYLNRPELTAERFVPDRFSGAAAKHLYRTGDLGRWRPDGRLEHLGRLDSQVKVRGFRIELGEIEASLAAHPDIAQAVALAREDAPGDVRLVAYYVARGAPPPVQQLREHARAFLPPYMVPQHFVPVSAIPLLPNGKIDRAALPAPEVHAGKTPPTAASMPTTETEKQLAEIWGRLLKTTDIRIDDNFYDIGGHSLIAMQAVLAMEAKTGKQIDRRRFIFETLGQLARAYDETSGKPERGAKRLLGRLSRFLGGSKSP